MKAAKQKNTSLWVLPAVAAAGAALLAVYWDDLYALFGSEEAVQRTVASWGSLGPVVFLAINVLQVIAAPIPGSAVGVAGGYLFGAWLGFALNITGIVLGSAVAFGLARLFGKPVVDRWVSPRTARFLARVAEKNGVRGLTLMFLIPFLPDDALCLIAGLTPIRWGTFLATVVVGRSPGSFVAALTGAGLVDLPLWAWIAVGAVSIGLVALWWTKGDAIERRVRRWFGRTMHSRE